MDTSRLQERAEFLAVETMVVILARLLRATSPAVDTDLRRQLGTAAGFLDLVHPAGADPEVGDLLMGQLQETWEQLCAKVLAEP